MHKYMSCITEFGFNSTDQFLNSLFRPKLMPLSIPIAMIGSFLQFVFGLEPVVFIAFVSLLSLELVSGIFASWIEGQRITSKRMKAFLMMLFVWLVVLFILNAFRKLEENEFISQTFDYLFYAVIIFITSIYFKSILENGSRIMNKKEEFKSIIGIFGKKLNKSDDDR